MPADLYIGLDIGTSGARALAMAEDGTAKGSHSASMHDHSADRRDPEGWRAAAFAALEGLCAGIDRAAVRAICVDGTSGTMIPVDAQARPLAPGRMYDDPCADAAILARIAEHAPASSAAHGPTSGLAKLMMFQDVPGTTQVLHQADWIAGQLCGVFASDDNNALKTGFDPVAGRWPDWIAQSGARPDLLPRVARPGTPLAALAGPVADRLGLPRTVQVTAGTTDGCAAFLATGAQAPGDGVTSLGTTLVLKLLSDTPIFAPEAGIYSHHVMGLWLAGGASNTGGGVLLDHFSADRIRDLTPQLDPETPLDLGYYPLRRKGERFPIADPDLPPRMEPRPENPAQFLQALLEGIADVEALGYARLHDLGGPRLKSVRSVGGGAQNPAWSRLRARRLGVPMPPPVHGEAAYGAAVLARHGLAQ